jgi:MFS family permease
MALQFGPQLLLLPVTGAAADRFDRRKLLMLTQAIMGILGLGLGLLTVTNQIQLWEVYAFALALGVVAAFDAPARQTFVNSLVSGENLSNAVALNSTSFNVARMIGPAIAGVLIALVGTGWVFLINAVSFAAVLVSLKYLRKEELAKRVTNSGSRVKLSAGFEYILQHPNIKVTLLIVFIIGTFGLNFPIFISTMNVTVFHANATAYGFLSTLLAIGSVTGALIAASREKPRIASLFTGSAIFGAACALAALMPEYWLFGFFLIIVGVAAQTITTSANSLVQLSAPAHLRGRIMAVYMAVFAGGTPIGAPIVGVVADTFGARWGMAVGAGAGFASMAVALYYLIRYRDMKISRSGYRFTMNVAPTSAITLPGPDIDSSTGSIQS